jgi:hypothetical protein
MVMAQHETQGVVEGYWHEAQESLSGLGDED